MLDDVVVLTIDTEWTPDKLIRNAADILNEYGVSATFFSTHDDGVSLDNHERGLHPNFFEDSISEEEVFEDISQLYPEATGSRSHGLYIHSGLRNLYPEHGISYESNYMMYGESGLHPFYMYDDVVQLPIYFMDDMWMRRGAKDFDVGDMLDKPGMKVLAFHPSHIYMNSHSIEFYEEQKEYYHDPKKLRENRYDDEGVTVLFRDILENIEEEGRETLTAKEASQRFRDSNEYNRF